VFLPGVSVAGGLRSGLVSADHEDPGGDVLAAATLHGVVHEPRKKTNIDFCICDIQKTASNWFMINVKT